MNQTSQRQYMMEIESLREQLSAANEHAEDNARIMSERVAALETECKEQARLLGIGGEREARLLAQIAAYHKDKACRDAADELDRLRAFIAAVHSRMHGPALTEATRRMLIAECEKEIPELGTIKTHNAIGQGPRGFSRGPA